VEQSITDFLSGLSKSITQGFIERGGIGNSIEEGIKKSRKKLFITGVAISLAATGFFLTFWGITSAIDAMFTMHGLGFVLTGLIGILAGGLVYKK
jgi:hypothetical protein